MLSKYDTNSFTIVYGRSRKQGYMGYYVRAGKEDRFFSDGRMSSKINTR